MPKAPIPNRGSSEVRVGGDTRKYQALSLREAGAYDRKHKIEGTWRDTRWHEISTKRAKAGTSRKARIRRKQEGS